MNNKIVVFVPLLDGVAHVSLDKYLWEQKRVLKGQTMSFDAWDLD